VLHPLVAAALDGVAGDVRHTAALLRKDAENSYGVMAPYVAGGERSLRANAVYAVAARINHSCAPNVRLSCVCCVRACALSQLAWWVGVASVAVGFFRRLDTAGRRAVFPATPAPPQLASSGCLASRGLFRRALALTAGRRVAFPAHLWIVRVFGQRASGAQAHHGALASATAWIPCLPV
jgi:hypothetical protein